VGLEQGELFVHRNVANLFIHSDLNYLSLLQYAVDYLDINHVIVCGHYGCGGVGAAMKNNQLRLVNNWLTIIRDLFARSKDELNAIKAKTARYDWLVELNVVSQVQNICHTAGVQNAWARGQDLTIHGLVYELKTGLLLGLGCMVSGIDQVDKVYHTTQALI